MFTFAPHRRSRILTTTVMFLPASVCEDVTAVNVPDPANDTTVDTASSVAAARAPFMVNVAAAVTVDAACTVVAPEPENTAGAVAPGAGLVEI